MKKHLKRRSFLAGGLAVSGLAAYSYHRGLRMPPLRWEPGALKNHFSFPWGSVTASGLINSHAPLFMDAETLFRAYSPEPTLNLSSKENRTTIIAINNISSDAELVLDSADQSRIVEEKIGITRVLRIDLKANQTLVCKWALPQYADYSFAAIGDTGGGLELEWCIKRAHQLNAKFLLHLGDFNYQAGDYENTVRLLHEAPLPCYVSIGNHDFHDEVTDFPKFLRSIGPLNHHFVIGNTRFANIDTGASFLPVSSGLRGKLFAELAQDTQSYASNIAFTHRPLFDPIEGSDHDIGNPRERDWLINALKSNHFTTLISGHIHIQARETVSGIDNLIVGQGLGHQDLITNSDYSKMALGRVNAAGQVHIELASLSMPMDWHCHPRNDVVKQSLVNGPHAEAIKAIDNACRQQTKRTQ